MGDIDNDDGYEKTEEEEGQGDRSSCCLTRVDLSRPNIQNWRRDEVTSTSGHSRVNKNSDPHPQGYILGVAQVPMLTYLVLFKVDRDV